MNCVFALPILTSAPIYYKFIYEFTNNLNIQFYAPERFK